MNRLNQTEPATFSILPRWAFFRDSYFTLFLKYDKQDRQGKAPLNERSPHPTQQ
jgi:hypothetical protein